VSEALAPEDAPIAPRRADATDHVPDPTAVEFDFDPDELPVDAIEVFDEPDSLDSDPGGIAEPAPVHDGSLEPTERRYAPSSAPPPLATPRPTPPPAPQRAQAIPSTPPPVRPREVQHSAGASVTVSLTAMVIVFLCAMLCTMLVVLVPWFTLVSPSLHTMLDRRAAAQAPPPPRIVEVPVPVPVAVPAAEVPREETADEAPEVAAAPAPAPVRAPVAPEPPVRSARSRRAVEPEPEPEPKAAPAPAPAPAAPTPAPAPSVPAAADALSGRFAGTSGGKPIILTLDFRPDGRLSAEVQSGTDAPVNARGSYALTGDRATVAFALPDGSAYAATVDSEQASGRLTRPDGKKSRFKLRR
jgi:hypothetical protein